MPILSIKIILFNVLICFFLSLSIYSLCVFSPLLHLFAFALHEHAIKKRVRSEMNCSFGSLWELSSIVRKLDFNNCPVVCVYHDIPTIFHCEFSSSCFDLIYVIALRICIYITFATPPQTRSFNGTLIIVSYVFYAFE